MAQGNIAKALADRTRLTYIMFKALSLFWSEGWWIWFSYPPQAKKLTQLLDSSLALPFTLPFVIITNMLATKGRLSLNIRGS